MKLLHVLLLLLLHSIDCPSQYNRSLLILVDAPFGHFQQHLLVMVAAVGWSSLHSDRVQCRSLGYQHTTHPHLQERRSQQKYHTYIVPAEWGIPQFAPRVDWRAKLIDQATTILTQLTCTVHCISHAMAEKDKDFQITSEVD